DAHVGTAPLTAISFIAFWVHPEENILSIIFSLVGTAEICFTLIGTADWSDVPKWKKESCDI
ncbi:hypothetical protein ACJX0J_029654, partial [Zea mays]